MQRHLSNKKEYQLYKISVKCYTLTVYSFKQMTDYIKYTDLKLAGLLKKGDQRAYTEIFERYNRLLIKHTFQILQNQELAADIVQDVFLALWQKRDNITFHTSLSSYLYKATRNKVFDALSHQKVVLRYADSISQFMEEGQYITDDLVREKELSALIEKEIASLPPRMQEVFRLSRERELSYKEIAEQLNISDQTAKLQVHNALKILRLKIGTLLSIFLIISGWL